MRQRIGAAVAASIVASLATFGCSYCRMAPRLFGLHGRIVPFGETVYMPRHTVNVAGVPCGNCDGMLWSGGEFCGACPPWQGTIWEGYAAKVAMRSPDVVSVAEGSCRVGRAQRAPPESAYFPWWGSLRSTHPTPWLCNWRGRDVDYVICDAATPVEMDSPAVESVTESVTEPDATTDVPAVAIPSNADAVEEAETKVGSEEPAPETGLPPNIPRNDVPTKSPVIPLPPPANEAPESANGDTAASAQYDVYQQLATFVCAANGASIIR